LNKIFLVNPAPMKEDEPIVDFIRHRFSLVDNPRRAELILVLGGDGAMLKAIRTYQSLEKIFAGLNYGHIGFLMNKSDAKVLEEILEDDLVVITVKMLQAELYDRKGRSVGRDFAFNDCYFERSTVQTAKIRVSVNGRARFDPLVGDGVLVSTSAGSTAYNASAGGVILPIDSHSMVLTGICPAVFHSWRTSILAAESVVELEAVEMHKRPVRFITDGVIKEDAVRAEVSYSSKKVRVAFAQSQDFREKVMNLQFYTPH